MNGLQRAVITAAVTNAIAGLAIAQGSLPGDEEAIEEVYVLGQKIERSLQDTKESVAVFDQSFIQTQRLFDLRDIFNQTANAFELFNGEDFGIRGVSASSASTGGGAGELGALFYDGVAYTGFARRFGPRALWDIEQVEILRGPQSTNVGRNALIGAVVMTSRSPNPDAFDAAMRLEAGDYGKRGFEGMVNVPITENTALRFTAETFETDGFVENIEIPERNFDQRDNQTFRGRFLSIPTDRLRIGATLQYAETQRGQQIYRADLLDDVEARISNANLPGSEDYEGWSGALDVSYALNDTWSLQSVTAFLDGEYDRFDDDDEGPAGGNAFRGRQGSEENWSQELRLTMTSDRLNGVAGLWYTEVDVLNDTIGLVNLSPADLGVPGAFLPFYPTVLELDVFFPAEVTTRNFAFFTEWDYVLSDRWTLSAGFRYDHEEQDQQTNNFNSLATGSELPDPEAAGVVADMLSPGSGAQVSAGVAQVNGRLQSFLIPTDNPVEETDYDAFLPQVGVTYSFSDNVSLSFFYKRGYRAGGSEVALTGGDIVVFDPEYLNNYEASLRSVWLDGSLVVNANAYFGDWTDQQVLSCPAGPLSCITVNAGESEIYGLELESRYTFNESASVYLTVGLSETEFTDFEDNGQDLSGNEFGLSPNVTAAIGGTYFFTDAFSVSGNVTYQDDSFNDIQNTIALDSRALLNLNARYQYKQFDIMLYGRNLTDEFYLQSDFTDPTGARIITPGAPREYGLLVQLGI
ncbi:MAG: TonB-dependent receptor [Pseudomonadota bacterium]